MADRPKRQKESRKWVHDRKVTETIFVPSADAVPDGYHQIPVASPAIFAKAQVLSYYALRPIFVKGDEGRRETYWVHDDIMDELSEWISCRVFPEHDILPPDEESSP